MHFLNCWHEQSPSVPDTKIYESIGVKRPATTKLRTNCCFGFVSILVAAKIVAFVSLMMYVFYSGYIACRAIWQPETIYSRRPHRHNVHNGTDQNESTNDTIFLGVYVFLVFAQLITAVVLLFGLFRGRAALLRPHMYMIVLNLYFMAGYKNPGTLISVIVQAWLLCILYRCYVFLKDRVNNVAVNGVGMMRPLSCPPTVGQVVVTIPNGEQQRSATPPPCETAIDHTQ